MHIHVSRILTRCIYADPDNLNKFNKSDAGLLAQMYLQLSKSGLRKPGTACGLRPRWLRHARKEEHRDGIIGGMISVIRDAIGGNIAGARRRSVTPSTC